MFTLGYIWITILNVFQLNNFWIVDTTTIDQALSSTIFSHLFFQDTVPSFNFFSVHAVSLFFAILPFYSIMPNFIGIYLIEYVLVFFSSVPLYLLARKIIGSGPYSFLIALSYLFYSLIYITGTDVAAEEIIMFAPLAIFSLYFYKTERKIPFAIAFALMLSTIEFAPFIGIFFLFYILVDLGLFQRIGGLIKRKDTRVNFSAVFKNFYLVSSLILSLSFLFLDSWMTLFFSHGSHPITINVEGTNFFSLQSLIHGLHYASSTKISFFTYLEYPYLFLSFLDPVFILQLPWLLVVAVSSSPIYISPGVYYGAFVAAFVPLGFVLGLKRIIGSNGVSGRSIAKKLIVITLVLLILSFAGGGTLQYIDNVSSGHISPQEQGGYFLSEMLKQGEGVDTGVNDLPIVEMNDWNVTYYNIQTKYVIFRGDPPFSLQGYGFYAADGEFSMYEKNYSSQPVYNFFNYTSEQGIGDPTTFSFFSPPGNYTLTLELSNVHHRYTISQGKSSGQTAYIPLGQAIAIPFSVKKSGTISAIAVKSIYEGSYYVAGALTSTLGNLSGAPVALTNFNECPSFDYIYLGFGNVPVQANKTYYVWVFAQTDVSANSGGVGLPKSQYGADAYIGDLSGDRIVNLNRQNFTVPITLIMNNDSSEYLPAIVSFGGNSYNYTLSAGNAINIPMHVASGGTVSISVRENFSNFVSFLGTDIVLSLHSRGSIPSLIILDNNWLVPLIGIGAGIILFFALYFLNIGERKGSINRMARNASLISFIAFWLFFILGYEGIVPFLYSFNVFRGLGIFIALAFLITIITYDWK
jgi:uncharacterized membrane protein